MFLLVEATVSLLESEIDWQRPNIERKKKWVLEAGYITLPKLSFPILS